MTTRVVKMTHVTEKKLKKIFQKKNLDFFCFRNMKIFESFSFLKFSKQTSEYAKNVAQKLVKNYTCVFFSNFEKQMIFKFFFYFLKFWDFLENFEKHS